MFQLVEGDTIDRPPAETVAVPVRNGESSGARLPWAMAFVGTVAVALLPWLVLSNSIDGWIDRVLESATGAGAVAVLVVAMLGLDTLLPIPSSVLATIAGARLGFTGATLAIAAGLCLGNAVGYVIGRTLGSAALARLVGPAQVARARTLVRTRPGSAALAVTRPVPIMSEAVMLMAGAARTPVARTAVVCGLANLGIAMAFAALGSAADGAAALPLLLFGSLGLPSAALAVTTAVLRRRTELTPALTEGTDP